MVTNFVTLTFILFSGAATRVDHSDRKLFNLLTKVLYFHCLMTKSFGKMGHLFYDLGLWPLFYFQVLLQGLIILTGNCKFLNLLTKELYFHCLMTSSLGKNWSLILWPWPWPFFFYFQVLLQGLIILTGNYNFFNLLTIVLCFSLLDDEFFGYKPKSMYLCCCSSFKAC